MVQGGTDADRIKIRLYPLRGAPQDLKPRTGTGGHGGGDAVMMADLFGPPNADSAGRVADERAGCYSILIGAAANQCFETGQPVRIGDTDEGPDPT